MVTPSIVTEEQRYAEALGWLYSLADQERGVGWNPAASADEQWKLGRTRALLDLAGKPDAKLKVVLVAGTKGKGSTCVFLAADLFTAGVKTGLYTKPHLQDYRERIRVDGCLISKADFADVAERFRGYVAEFQQEHPEAGEPTTFEVTTAMAIDHFARAGCAVAVVEVGLGGRLDATNALEPVVSVITPISHDHTQVLGKTLKEIAREKGRNHAVGTVVTGPQRTSARQALMRHARTLGVYPTLVMPLGLSGVTMSLKGEHQRANAGLAYGAAERLVELGMRPPWSVGGGGYRLVRWPGRFEVLDGAPPLVLDGAHNDASAEALKATLDDERRGHPYHLVIGLNRDKDARAVLKPLVPGAASVWTVQATGNARALTPEGLARQVRRYADEGARVTGVADIGEALVRAKEAAAEDGGWVCVTGSLAVVGQARDALGLPVEECLFESAS